MRNDLLVARAKRRISQRALAKRAGIHDNRYWRIENEYTEPTPEEQTAIAKALGFPIEELFPDAGRQSETGSAPVASQRGA